MNSSRVLKGYAGTNPRRGISVYKQGPIVVHQKPGPLQMIFDLLPDEIVQHSYSCAMERSCLYHGRMYVSAWHICFHSNVIIPFGDIDEIRRSQHAVINPAVTIVLRMGAGGHGVPPLRSPDGDVLVIFDVFPRTAEQILDMLLNDGSNFTSEYRSARKDTNLNVFETVQQAHDVPFGSYFEVHRWHMVTTSESSSSIDVKVGKFLPHSSKYQLYPHTYWYAEIQDGEDVMGVTVRRPNQFKVLVLELLNTTPSCL
ncbi:hypothetical protein L1887_04779 [Cichorium endivia]|nr:hypothetical protein L1887_04779 [Cichorium endivia]